MRRVLIALVAGFVMTASAGAQTPTGRDRARAALPPDVFQQVDVLVTSAIQEGLPAEPLWDKALEGAAKRVPPTRITPVVEEYSSRLRTARGALGGAQTPATLVAAADALRRGVPQEVLGRLGASDQRTPIALVVLGDLVETGVPADRALDVVRAALARRAADEDMLGLSARVRAAMRRGQSAAAAADGVRRAISDRRVEPRGGAVGPPARPGSEPTTRDAVPQDTRRGR